MSIESKISKIADNVWLCVFPRETECDVTGTDTSSKTRAKLKADILALFTEQQEEMVKALSRAARQAYQNEIIDAEMQHISIGRGKEWETKEDWIKDRITEWMVK